MYKYDDAPRILRDFLTHKLTIEGRSEKTVQEYYYDLKGFLSYIKTIKNYNGEPDAEMVRDITLTDIYDYLLYIGKVKENGARTRARRIAAIKSFYKYLYYQVKIVDNNPTDVLTSPKLKKTQPVHLELSESKKLLSSVSGRNKERDYCILTLFLNCGLRLSELVGININDIREDTLKVLGKGNKERTIYLNSACRDAIEKYLAVRPKDGLKDRNALFISGQKNRIYYKTVQYLVKKYLAVAGMDITRYSTHKLRHTAATLMYKYGNVDVKALQEILGHEQLNTTQIYTHIGNQQLKEAMEKNPLADFDAEEKE